MHNIDPFLTSSKELTDLLVLFFLAARINRLVGELQPGCSEQDADLATLAPPPSGFFPVSSPGPWSSSAPKILTVMVTPLRLTMTGMSSSYTILGLRSSPAHRGNTSQSSVREFSRSMLENYQFFGLCVVKRQMLMYDLHSEDCWTSSRQSHPTTPRCQNFSHCSLL